MLLDQLREDQLEKCSGRMPSRRFCLVLPVLINRQHQLLIPRAELALSILFYPPSGNINFHIHPQLAMIITFYKFSSGRAASSDLKMLVHVPNESKLL